MSRINLVPLDLAEPKALVDAIRRRRGGQLSNLDRLLLNSPALAEGWNTFLGTVRQKLSLTPKVREIVMCSVAVLNKAEYEFFHHVREFEKAGGTPEQVEAMRDVGTDHGGVVAAGVEDQKTLVVQKLGHQRLFVWRRLAKRCRLGDVVKTLSGFTHQAGTHVAPQFSVNAGVFFGQIFTAKNLAGA